MAASYRFAWLDYGRFFAALAVVIFHYCSNGIRNGVVGADVERWPIISAVADYGYFGVSFFFIISGFVIFQSITSRTPDQFAVSRATRLFPAFWFCMPLTVLIVSALGYQEVSLWQFIANWTMLPRLLGFNYIDGVYWTLQLEFVFYTLMFLACVVGLNRRPMLLIWISILGVLTFHATDTYIPIFGRYAAYFALGMSLSVWYRSPSSPLAILMVAIAAALSIESAYSEAVARAALFPNLRPTIVALLCCSLVAAFPLFRWVPIRDTSLSRMAGAISYPLYLLHAHIGYSVMNAYQTEANKWLVTPLLIITMILAATWVARNVEERTRNFWRGFFDATVGKLIRASRLQTWAALTR